MYFLTLVRSTKSLNQLWCLTTAPDEVVQVMYYSIIVIYDKILAHICALSWIPVKGSPMVLGEAIQQPQAM